MTRPRLDTLPDWPRWLSTAEAARYVGVGETTFIKEVRAGVWPAGDCRGRPGRGGGRVLWDRKALDLASDRRSGLGSANPPRPSAADRVDRCLPAR